MTEGMVLVAGGKVGEALVGKVIDTFQELLLSKHRDYRVKAFVHQLGEALIEQGFTGAADEDIDFKLRKYLADENNSEAFFEIYRRVFLSASKEIGPRVTAMLAARLIVQDRFANTDEEAMFLAAEQMNDVELRRLAQFVNEAAKSAEIPAGIREKNQSALEQMEKYGEVAIYEQVIGHVPYFFTRLVNFGIAAIYSSSLWGGTQHVAILANNRTRMFAQLIDRATGPEK